MLNRKLIIKEEAISHIRKIAYFHNMTPKQWIKDYEISDSDVHESVQNILDKDENDIYISVVEENEAIIGFIWANREFSKSSFMIMSLYVDAHHRNKGIASRLKSDFECWCKNNNVNRVNTTVHVSNENMLNLNNKLGYEANMIHMSKIIK